MSRVRVLVERGTLVALVFLAVGCSPYWGRRPLDQPTPVKPDDAVLIWSHGGFNTWHAVVVTQDSVSGIPHEMSLTCDSCRLSLPRSQVDSMQLAYLRHHIESKVVLQVGGAVALAILAEIVVCTLIGAAHDAEIHC
jgi:hypothetical protein